MTKDVNAKTWALHEWPDGTRRSRPNPFVPGVWVNITPPIEDIEETFGVTFVALDPSVQGVAYACADERGLWKTVNFGASWVQVGVPDVYNYDGSTTFLDSPTCLAVDPDDSDHMYATQGIRGETLGFWVTTDGGVTWNIPAAFLSLAATTTIDVTTMVVNPEDFDHILIGSHSTWAGSVTAGLMESRDGGVTWDAHDAEPTWPDGSLGIAFLFDAESEQGDEDTWLVMTDGDGCWKTEDAGDNWTKVATTGSVHHGCRAWYASDGSIYIGGQPYPMRSTDNGDTWTQLTSGLTNLTYYTVHGDGETLYTQIANTGNNAGGSGSGTPLPWMITSEASPGAWTEYEGGAQEFTDGPYVMQFDPESDIMYAAQWREGVWALKVLRA